MSDQEFKIKIATEADLKGTKEATKALHEAKEKLKEIANEIPGIKPLSEIFEKLASGPLGAVAAGAVGAGVAIGVMEKALHEFAGQEEAVAGMNAAFAQSG